MKTNSIVRSPLKKIKPTIHGGLGWKLDNIEDYSHNLNPFGPPKEIDEIITSAIKDISHYPDDSSIEYRTEIAKHYSIDVENVIPAAGSSDIIRMFPNTFFNSGDPVLLFSPSFAEYSQQCKIVGANIEYLPLKKKNDFRIDVNELIGRLPDVRAVYICNPNNPTGRVEPRSKILEIIKESKTQDVLVFLDETLLELVYGYDKITCIPYVNKYSNLVIAGSFTKSFAIPGIRIGYGITNKNLAKEMNKVRMTWNIGAIEQKVGECLIRDHMDYVFNASKVMSEESKRMFDELKNINFPVEKVSDSFFYFCDISSLKIDTGTFINNMKSNGILVRDCSSFGKDFTSYIRFSIKTKKQNDLFLKAVKKSMM